MTFQADASRPASPGAALRRARVVRNWSQHRLIREIQHVATEMGLPVPTAESLKVSVSRWERDRKTPSEFNRRLLCAALDIELAELGLPIDPDYEALWERMLSS